MTNLKFANYMSAKSKRMVAWLEFDGDVPDKASKGIRPVDAIAVAQACQTMGIDAVIDLANQSLDALSAKPKPNSAASAPPPPLPEVTSVLYGYAGPDKKVNQCGESEAAKIAADHPDWVMCRRDESGTWTGWQKASTFFPAKKSGGLAEAVQANRGKLAHA